MNHLINFKNKIINSSSKLITPTELIFFITERCNARCKHCFIKDLNSPIEPDINSIDKIVKTFKEPLNTVVLTGGEPFLRKDIKGIIQKFYSINKPHTIIICTNGMLTDKICNSVKELTNDFKNIDFKIQISLDGLKDTHDRIRNVSGIFDKTVETIKSLKQIKNQTKNLDIILLTVISNENISEIEKLYEFVEKELKVVMDFELIRGSSFFNIPKSIIQKYEPSDDSLICPSMNILENTKFNIDNIYKKNCKKNYSSLKAPIAYAYKSAKYDFILDLVKNKKPVKTCGAGKEWGVIYANLDVGLCEMLKNVGNLNDFDLDFEKLWNSEKANDLRKKMKCYCTHSCFLDNTMFNKKTSYLNMLKKIAGYYIK